MSKIEVTIKKTWCKQFYTIEPKRISYSDFLKFGANLTANAINYGKSKGRTYPQEIELYANDVSCSHYDHQSRECNYTATTKKDVENWLLLYKDFFFAPDQIPT